MDIKVAAFTVSEKSINTLLNRHYAFVMCYCRTDFFVAKSVYTSVLIVQF